MRFKRRCNDNGAESVRCAADLRLFLPVRGTNQWIRAFISKIGSNMANTIPITKRPIATISAGPCADRRDGPFCDGYRVCHVAADLRDERSDPLIRAAHGEEKSQIRCTAHRFRAVIVASAFKSHYFRNMGANPDSEEFDDGDEIAPEDEELNLARAIKDMDIAKRHSAKLGAPAWRRLEQRLEQRRMAEQISDFEDYDIGDPARAGPAGSHPRRRSAPRR